MKKLKTNKYPKVEGIIYNLTGEIGEELFVSYVKEYDCLMYVGVDEIHQDILEAATISDLVKEARKYRSLHYNDNKKRMTVVSIMKDISKEDKKELEKYKYKFYKEEI